MSTIMSLFKQRQDDIFDIQSKGLIESRGVIDGKRIAALSVASPNTIGGLIGSTAAGLIGGSANRPTDTIFPSPNFFAKPVSLTRPTQALLANAIDKDKNYYVKQHPSPALLGTLSTAKNLISNKGAQQSAAIEVLNKFGGNKAGAGKWLKGLKGDFDTKTGVNSPYRKKYSMDGEGKINRGDDILYSTHYRSSEDSFQKRTFTRREVGDKSYWERQNSNLITLIDTNSTGTSIKKFLEEEPKTNTPYVMFKVYGDNDNNERTLIFPATITGLTEDINTNVNSFKYVGSPFNLYRYSGVERVVRFDLKFYYTTVTEKTAVIKKLNLLREYAFPDRNLTSVKYQNSDYSPIYYNPNILQVTIDGYYNNVMCILESLAINVEDTTSWPSMDASNQYEEGSKKEDTKPFPSVVDTSISLKIIEIPALKDNKFIYGNSGVEGNKYTNYFTDKSFVNIAQPVVDNTVQQDPGFQYSMRSGQIFGNP